MTGSFTVGLVQMTSGRDLAPNIEAASALIREARAQGADFVLTPETTTMMEPSRSAPGMAWSPAPGRSGNRSVISRPTGTPATRKGPRPP